MLMNLSMAQHEPLSPGLNLGTALGGSQTNILDELN